MLTHVKILRPIFTLPAGTILPVFRMDANGRVTVKAPNAIVSVNPKDYEPVERAPRMPQEEG